MKWSAESDSGGGRTTFFFDFFDGGRFLLLSSPLRKNNDRQISANRRVGQSADILLIASLVIYDATRATPA